MGLGIYPDQAMLASRLGCVLLRSGLCHLILGMTSFLSEIQDCCPQLMLLADLATAQALHHIRWYMVRRSLVLLQQYSNA